MMGKYRDYLELLGIGAVVIGLFFVGYELRQNQIGMQAQIRGIQLQTDLESLRSQREDERLLVLLSKEWGFENTDRARHTIYNRELTRTAEHDFFQYRIGALNSEEFEVRRYMWRSQFSQPTYRDWWERFKSDFSSSFRKEFDRLLLER